MSPAMNKPIEISCVVTRLELMNDDVFRVGLKPESDQTLSFYAGQYLEILLPDGKPCAFSIASSPEASQELELHIHFLSDKPALVTLFDLLENSEKLQVRLPMGSCHVGQLPAAPLLFVAAGTGFAQMKSMIEHALEQQHPHDIHLYWGARQPEGLYLPGLPRQWSEQNLLTYHPVVSDADPAGDWSGRDGLLYEAILADELDKANTHVFLSGSPQMVYGTVDALVAAGFREENMHSDVFAYAPRG